MKHIKIACLLFAIAFMAACTPKVVEEAAEMEEEPKSAVIKYGKKKSTVEAAADEAAAEVVEAVGDFGEDVEEEVVLMEVHSDEMPPMPGEGEKKTTEITFVENFYDFGTVKLGTSKRHTFKFTNTGEHDLVIDYAAGSCGCTIVEDYTKGAIKPGESGEMMIKFDGNKDKLGQAKTEVTIMTNTLTGIEEIKIRATVVE